MTEIHKNIDFRLKCSDCKMVVTRLIPRKVTEVQDLKQSDLVCKACLIKDKG